MNVVSDLLTGNHILNVCILTWFSAQVLKLLLVLITEKRFDLSRMTGSGGMPSAHSAVVTALAASAGKVCGTGSPEFAVAAMLAFITMYDASNVRRAAGEQARILNYMMDNWDDSTPDLFGKELKELLGHTPIEVIAGAVLGFCIGVFI